MSICSTISVKSVRIDRQCDSTFANGEVKGVKGVKTYVLLLKILRQKDYCLNSSATVGSDNSFNSLTPLISLTPLTSKLAIIYIIRYKRLMKMNN